jgi:hypothetical protein
VFDEIVEILPEEENHQKSEQQNAADRSDAQHVALHAQQHAGLPGKVLFMNRDLEVVADEPLVGVDRQHRKQCEQYRRKED